MFIRKVYYFFRALRNLRLERSEIEKFQQRRLERILELASELEAYPDTEELEEFPVSGKEDLKALNEEVGDRADLSVRTSGSTQTASVLFDFKAKDWLSAIEMRTLLKSGYGIKQEMGLSETWELPDRGRLSEFLFPIGTLSQEEAPEDRYERICSEEIDFLKYYPYNLMELLVEGDERPGKPEFDTVVTYGQNLTENLEEFISERTGAEVKDFYALTEFGTVAWSCPEAGYHVNDDSVYFEVLDEEGKPVDEGEVGELTITGLANEVIPLVRYGTGDLVRKGGEPCSCQNTFSKISEIKGRRENCLETDTGEKVYPDEIVDLIMGFEDVRGFNLREDSDAVVVELVGDDLNVPKRKVQAKLESLLEGREVTVDEDQRLEKTPGGKLIYFD